jgi:hypothetical protein
MLCLALSRLHLACTLNVIPSKPSTTKDVNIRNVLINNIYAGYTANHSYSSGTT